MFKGEAELTAQKWCNLCHGRERDKERVEMDESSGGLPQLVSQVWD